MIRVHEHAVLAKHSTTYVRGRNSDAEGEGSKFSFSFLSKEHDVSSKRRDILFFVMYESRQDAGVEIDPLGDLNTEAERKLGQLVLEK